MRKDIKNLTEYSERSEKAIEAYLKKQTEAAGGISLKFSSHNDTGYPDRLCLFPGGVSVWVELKSKGKKPTLLQRMRIDRLNDLGHAAFVCDSRETVDKIITDTKKKAK